MIYSNAYFIIIPLLLGYILDLIIGDPYMMPHPIKLFGNIISIFELKFNKGNCKIYKGLAMVFCLISFTWLSFSLLFNFLQPYIYAKYIIATIFVFYGLANKSLITEGLKVEKQLTLYGLQAARKQLSNIVGRTTSALSENQIRIAILETLSENLSDGVIAPLFYYAIGGVPLMMAYKMVNTLDSMIGYKNERYKNFGKVAARTDDVANFIPARITAILMVLVTFSYKGLTFIFKYGHQHSSPNSGYPESALAGILNCRFGGTNVYNGKTVFKPFIGANNRKITSYCIKKACLINIIVSILSVLIIIITNCLLKGPL